MPQLDLAFFKENILFSLFAFGFFYAFLYRFIIKKFFLIKRKREEFFSRMNSSIASNLEQVKGLQEKINFKKEQNNNLIQALVLAKKKEIENYKKKKQQEFDDYKKLKFKEQEDSLNTTKSNIEKEVFNNIDKLLGLLKKGA
jgi:F0F1-type ATP synthase membrane subunit b/b'